MCTAPRNFTTTKTITHPFLNALSCKNTIACFLARLCTLGGLLGPALLPALAVEKLAVGALPGELLVADAHVVGLRSGLAVVVSDEEHVLEDGQDADGGGNEQGDLDPLPHLVELLGLGLVGLVHDVLLAGDPGLDLGQGLLLHLGLAAHPGDGLGRSAGADAGGGGGGGPGGYGPCGELSIFID